MSDFPLSKYPRNKTQWDIIMHIANGPQREHDALLRWKAQENQRLRMYWGTWQPAGMANAASTAYGQQLQGMQQGSTNQLMGLLGGIGGVGAGEVDPGGIPSNDPVGR